MGNTKKRKRFDALQFHFISLLSSVIPLFQSLFEWIFKSYKLLLLNSCRICIWFLSCVFGRIIVYIFAWLITYMIKKHVYCSYFVYINNNMTFFYISVGLGAVCWMHFLTHILTKCLTSELRMGKQCKRYII